MFFLYYIDNLLCITKKYRIFAPLFKLYHEYV